MTVENYLAQLAAFATLAGILAGFSISAALQLLTINTSSKLVTAIIAAFATSTVLFLYALVVFIMSFAVTAENGAVLVDLTSIGAYALIALLGALIVFLGAVGMTGWIRSKLTGLITTGLGSVAILITIIAVASILSASK